MMRMLASATKHLQGVLRRRRDLIPYGYRWSFVITIDVSLLVIIGTAMVQRPDANLAVTVVAAAAAASPLAMFYLLGAKFSFSPWLMWAVWSAAAGLLLFGTSTPVPSDFAPLLLVLIVAGIAGLGNTLGGILAAASAVGMLATASAIHRLDAVGLYLGFVGMGWLVGYLMQVQQQLIVEQQQAQLALTEHASAEERRRIAREVHDVIAHSLSITLLHVTGARRGLQQDRDINDAVEALRDAERMGRQAMTDIRRTVGLLDQSPMKGSAEPGIDEIPDLIDDFVRAGLTVSFNKSGSTDAVSPAVGLAVYRIAQESLSNIAKHSPRADSSVTLAVSRRSVELCVHNELPIATSTGRATDGRGLRGMRQRVELLGGVIEIGPSTGGWTVWADIPLEASKMGARNGSRVS